MSVYNNLARRSVNLAALDGVTDAGPTSGVYISTAGDVVVVLADDPLTVQTTFTAVPAGTWLPICIKKWVSGPLNSQGVAT